MSQSASLCTSRCGRCDRTPSFWGWTPDGAAALRRAHENFKNRKLVGIAAVQAVMDAAGVTR